MSSSTEGSRREAVEAKVRASQELEKAQQQRPLIHTEAQTVSWLLQQNNLGPRFRKAMKLRFGGNG